MIMPKENVPRAPEQSAFTASDRERPAATELPIQEIQQPDPMLQITTGRIGAGGLSLLALVIAVIVGVVFYGLNSGLTPEHAAATPPATASKQAAASGNSSAATPPAKASKQPAAGGTSSAAKPGSPGANDSGTKG
jgi:hypothetical protein